MDDIDNAGTTDRHPDGQSGATSGEMSAELSAELDPALADLQRDAVTGLLRDMCDDDLHHVAEVVRRLQTERAISSGDHDAIIGAAFESNVIVCPGGMVSKSRTSHRCRFVSVDDCWVWDSGLLLREDKRSSPGSDEGFRAIALLPLIDGTELDVVAGRSRSGQHSVEHVVSYEVRRGELVEVGQRTVNASHGRQI
jgi:hypothetical protein